MRLAPLLTVFTAAQSAYAAQGAPCPDGVGNDTSLLEPGKQRIAPDKGVGRHRGIIDRLMSRGAGDAFRPVSTQNNMCLDADGLRNSAKLQLWNCANTDNQKWRIEGPLLQTGGDMCLDMPNGWAFNGAQPQLWKCDGQNKNQHWQRVGNTLAFQGGAFCLDVTNGWYNNGNQIQLWTCYPGSANQAFNFGSQQAGQSASTQSPGTGATNFYGYNCISLDQFVSKYPQCRPFKDALQAAASDQGLNPVFLGAIAMIESGCNPYPAGPNGRFGPFQFMYEPAWTFYGGEGKDKTNFWDAAYGAARYFKALLQQTNGNLHQSMRLYNGEVVNGGEPHYQEWAAGYMAGTR